MLGSCSPAPSESKAPEVIDFQFTEENFPVMDGSTATIPLGEAVMSMLLAKPRNACELSFSTTDNAYYHLRYEEVDILLVYDGAGAVREEVDADTLFETASIGRDGLVFLVNQGNPVDDLTSQHINEANPR